MSVSVVFNMPNSMGDESPMSDMNVRVKHKGEQNRGSEQHNNGETYNSANTLQNNTSPKLNLMAELFESEDDDNSEVESFTLDEEPVLDTSKFLLSAETTGIHLGDTPEIDPESRAKLEALLEAAAYDKHLIDPDLLRRLTSSVSCALDEAAAALAKMRINDAPLSSITPLTTANVIHKQQEHDNPSNVEGSIILNERFNVNEMTEDGESFLSLACSSGRYDLAEQLLKVARVNVEDRGLKDTTPLMEASIAGHVDIVKLLLDNGAEVNAQTSQGNTPLMYSCASGHEDVVKLLLKSGANVEDHNENGHTSLMEASSAGHVEVAKILVEHGASINTHSNEFKESALTLACYKGHLEMVRFLLEAGADQEHKTDEMHTALMEASMDGHVEVARLLLDSGAQVNMPVDSFESPLTLAACGGHVELAMLLLERGANIEEVNDEGYTPLMEAAREGHEEMVALLLSQGADINAQTEETQETALTLACCGGFLDVADFLIKAGADIESGANTPLMEAAQEGHLDLVRHLINAGANVNAKTTSGDTALMYACENGHTDVAELLLQAGANLEHEAEGGRTPLMKAARAGHLCTVQFLINRGAKVNKVTTNNDHTPLSLSCAGGHLAVVELLLANGADPTHRLKDNSTMLIEAAKGGHTTVVQLLIDYPSTLITSPPPVDVSQLTTTEETTIAPPRVPTHGLQSEDASTKVHSSPAPAPLNTNVQGKSNVQKNTAKKSINNKDANITSTNTLSSKTSETTEGFVHLSKGRGNKILERSLSDSGTSLFSSASCLATSEASTFSNVAAAAVDELERVQAQWQQQLLQCYQASLSGSALSQGTATIPSDMSSFTSNVPSPCLDISKLQKQLKIGESPFQIPTSAPTILQHASVSSDSFATNASNLHSVTTSAVSSTFTASICSNTSTIAPSLPTPPVNRRLRSNSKSKSSTLKQHLQHHASVATKSSNSSQSPSEDVEKMNLKNAVDLEAALEQTSAITTAVNQTQSLLQQQQMILSELAQNPATLQFLQAAANNIKIDNTLPLWRLFDPNTLSQQTSQVQQIPTNTQSVTSPSTTTATTLTSSAQDFTKKAVTALKTNKSNKSVKGVSVLSHFQQNLSQQNTPTSQPLTNQLSQNVALQSITNDQIQLLKSQISAASASTQTDAPSAIQQISALSCPTSVINSSSGGTTSFMNMNTCTSTANSGGLFSIGAPAFPVPLTLSPPSPSTTAANRTIISTIIPYPVSLEDGSNSLIVSSQSNIDDNAVDLNAQITANSVATNTISTSCVDSSNFIVPGSLSNMFANTLPPSSGFEPLTFPSVSASSVLSASLTQPSAVNFSALTSNMTFPNLSSTIGISDQMTTGSMMSIQQMEVPLTIAKADVTNTVTSTSANNNMSIPSPPPWYPPIDLDSQTDSNHDTALTLACAGGHEELVSLLLSRGAEMEHRDKKGFTPLMLSATAGHANVVEIMLNNGAEMEAQSERTKDTALSLACSSGRYEVVEILLMRGANKEHRNVSDYTPLSLAASGGYVNIIKLLLNNGAEINSRTGSKLGISPLMLAAMNGHAATVKLLLDMGSDINAQIETNRNTALTLACFQGRCEVVGLLLDRKANVEHRAKTGLTPLMEAASGGYVEVGRVLLDKSADVNAPPVPSSRDTALTIAADKGHYRFVELLLCRGAAVDVKNKKGNSPLWLACNGGHLDVVQLLVNAGCDIDSQDNRKVSCLMAAFRKGHVKVVKWMVKHVNQFPSDQEMARYIALINDKELLKKCNQCTEILKQAKERQAAEANKNATILLEEIDMERSREENRKAAAARRRERKRQKKKEKQEMMKVVKVDDKKDDGSKPKPKDTMDLKQIDYDDENYDDDDYDDDDSNDEDEDENDSVSFTINEPQSLLKDAKQKQQNQTTVKTNIQSQPQQTNVNKKKDNDKNKKQLNQPQTSTVKKKEFQTPSVTNQQTIKGKKKDEPLVESNYMVPPKTSSPQMDSSIVKVSESVSNKSVSSVSSVYSNVLRDAKNQTKTAEKENNANINKSDAIFEELSVELPKDVNGNSSGNAHLRSPNYFTPKGHSSSANNGTLNMTQSIQLKKGQKREEGWKEVVRKSKKVVVPANAISRVIGRGGCNINTIREISGAHIEVEKQKGQGDRMVIIKGSADATRNAQQLIAALSKEAEKDLSEIIKSLGLSRPTNVNSDESGTSRTPCKSSSTVVMGSTIRQSSYNSSVLKSASATTVPISSSGMTITPSQAPFSNRSTVAPIRTSSVPQSNTSPFASTSIGTWNPKTIGGKITSNSGMMSITGTTSTKATVSYTMAVAAKGRNTKTTSVSNTVPAISKVISSADVKPSGASFSPQVRPTGGQINVQPFNQMNTHTGARVSTPVNNQMNAKTLSYHPNVKQPFNNVQTVTSSQTIVSNTVLNIDTVGNERSASASGATTPEYTPFNNLFSKVAQSTVWGQSKDSQKPNFASVAASGLTSIASSVTPPVSATLILPISQNTDQESFDASKAPGYRGNLHVSPSNASTPSSSSGTSNLGPIGSGPRSAPCTPPLASHTGPLTPSNNSGKMSSPPMSSTPTPPPPQQPQQSPMSQQQRSISDSQNIFNMSDFHMNGSSLTGAANCTQMPLNIVTNISSSAIVTTYQSVVQSASSAHMASSVSNTVKPSSYNMPSSGNMQRLYSTNTTYSQHSPLASAVGTQSNSEHNTAMYSGNNVQSNLNPNAPDFATRSVSHHSLNGPQMGNQPRMSSNMSISSNVTQPQVQQQQPTAILLQDQMRAAILAASCNLQLQTLQNQQAARMHYASGNPPLHHQMSAPEPTPETLRLLHTAINSLPPANMLNAPHNQPHYNMMQQQPNYMQQRQTMNQRLTQQSIGALSTKNLEADCEERKLPPPIGTERAQRKNPAFSPGIGGSITLNDSNQSNLWPFNCGDMSGVDTNEWMNQQQHLHPSLSSDSLPNFIQRYGAGEETQHFDQTYQMNVGSHVANAVNYQTVNNPQLPLMNMNGVPPHLLSNSLYASASSTAGLSSSQDADYWSGKIPPLSSTGLGNGLPSGQQNNVDQKMWNNWNHHT